MKYLIILFVSLNLFAATCTNDDVQRAQAMYDKYFALYEVRAITYPKLLMAERMLYKARYCAEYITTVTYCDLMYANLEKIRTLQPDIYVDNILYLQDKCVN